MIGRFYFLTALLSLLLIAALAHFSLFDRENLFQKQRELVAVTDLDSPALSVEYFEPRLRRFERSLNPAYPELLPTDRLDFVYGDLNGK
ncbi:hypothetical protein [Nitratifractor salsuginis]|uniref:Uncharacterized protein n=1 Tax=Nitratifractor salsuginis (strain DSM 16511 / JCM 12458 / E9I37-1) TaxID=749222 RepID=E6X0R6_NITSE|nr:hypothetical protein [Nitratifractor salsuginis]ADV45786.1 hypothetical protein Nitsa_0516 [Nitratifractor salsuginis DSM 16511]